MFCLWMKNWTTSCFDLNDNRQIWHVMQIILLMITDQLIEENIRWWYNKFNINYFNIIRNYTMLPFIGNICPCCFINLIIIFCSFFCFHLYHINSTRSVSVMACGPCTLYTSFCACVFFWFLFDCMPMRMYVCMYMCCFCVRVCLCTYDYLFVRIYV